MYIYDSHTGVVLKSYLINKIKGFIPIREHPLMEVPKTKIPVFRDKEDRDRGMAIKYCKFSKAHLFEEQSRRKESSSIILRKQYVLWFRSRKC